MLGRKQHQDVAASFPPQDFEPSKDPVKRATRARLRWALFSSFLLLLSVVFLVLVQVGNTKADRIRSRIYFIKIDVSDIIPVSVPNALLLNSIAQTLGLHDFYSVGLWSFCEGYNGQGVTACSTPRTLFWVNPVETIQRELLAGATIALPAETNDMLDLIRQLSHCMFGLFLAGACLGFVVMFLLPLSVYTRWLSLPLSTLTLLAALATTVAAVIATVMFTIMKNAITSATQLNMKAKLGREMFVLTWTAAGASTVAFVLQLGMCCCCASRRHVGRGKKTGRPEAGRGGGAAGIREKAGKGESPVSGG